MMYGVRASSFNENFLNESEQDANSVLMELDKGLRSSKLGEQCEAIVRFPKLFEKYPFPILINSSFLKLAEFFRQGSNLMRLWVLRVCQQSEKHLEKILNVDEFVKRLFMVMHSNDPVARALTLRTLGAVAGVIPEKQQVHHAIRCALDSHDMVEVEAAIDASVQFAAQSKTFAISMCSKVATMIENLQTPVNMKLQLIPVLRHMHHDATTAALVKTLCLDLLPKYPSESFVIVIIDSLTKLTCATLVDIPDQVSLLLNYLHDPRRRVRFQVLHSLQSLAKKGAHLWPKGALQNLISMAIECKDLGDEQSLVLAIFSTLTDCPVTCHLLLNKEQSLVLELCSSCLVLEHHWAASQALTILTSLVSYCYTENKIPPSSYMEQINLHLEGLIYSSLNKEKLTHPFAQYLKCGVRLADKDEQIGESFLKLIGGLLVDDFAYPVKHSILICETLGALSSQLCQKKYRTESVDSTKMEVDQTADQSDPLIKLLPKLLRKLESIADSNDCDNQTQVIEVLSAVCLQTMLGHFMPYKVFLIFEKVINVTGGWTQYRIARSAARYGHHFLASLLFERLSARISMEKMHFFLIALSQISKAECVLNNGQEFEDLQTEYATFDPAAPSSLTIGERLDKAVCLYWKALANLIASSSPSNPFTFQAEFIRLRGKFLETLLGIVVTKNTQYISPPPAIAQTLAQNSRDHLQKYGRVTNQLRKSVKLLKENEDLYSKLYKSAFDADPGTLEYLEVTEFMCAIIGNSVETICFVSPSEPPITPAEGNYPETKFLLHRCNKVAKELEKLPNEQGVQKTITNKHTDIIIDQIEIVTKSPLGIPRFFFQVLQNTSIKLSISPQPRISGEPVVVQPGSSLVVKVEGVIQHYGKIPSLYRAIDSVQLTLVSQLLGPKTFETKAFNGTDTVATQTVKSHRDFISGSFLLALNNQPPGSSGNNGQWQVTLEACVIDKNGVVWHTGPKSMLTVHLGCKKL